MPLPESTRRKQQQPTRKRLNFMRFEEGQHEIRFLHALEGTLLEYTHWVNRTSVKCLGEDCPVCSRNYTILAEVGGEGKEAWTKAKENSDFRPWQERYFANVLDRTLVKVHPDCEVGFENKRDAGGNWPTVCQDCGLPLVDVKPQSSNKVKILASGPRLFDQLAAIERATVTREEDESGIIESMIGLENFDILLMVDGEGRERRITPIPKETQNDVIELEELELYDLEKSLVVLSSEELIELMRGVSIRDIFAARRVDAPEVSEETKENYGELSDELKKAEEDVEEELEELFK